MYPDKKPIKQIIEENDSYRYSPSCNTKGNRPLTVHAYEEKVEMTGILVHVY